MRGFDQDAKPSRVNIALSLADGHDKEEKELPLKLLVLGDFSQAAPKDPLHARKRHTLNDDSFNTTLAKLNPKLNLQVANHIYPDKEDLKVDLSFSHIKDFKPDGIIDQVPELKRLLMMRQLLKDLKSRLIDNRELQKKLTDLVKDKSKRAALLQYFNQDT